MAETQAPVETYIEAARDVRLLLRDYGLPEEIVRSVWRSLAYFMAVDGDPIAPDFGSLTLLLGFLAEHPALPAPSLGITRHGVIDATWASPRVYRWTLVFHPVGGVDWTYLENNGGIKRRAGKARVADIEIPEPVGRVAAAAAAAAA